MIGWQWMIVAAVVCFGASGVLIVSGYREHAVGILAGFSVTMLCYGFSRMWGG